jgi:hypothetical protein
MPALVAMVAIPLGIILLLNPLSMFGFGTLGPVAGQYNPRNLTNRPCAWLKYHIGTLAALWQAHIGIVIAGSLFAILQSGGMVYGRAISLTGGIVVGLGAVAAWFM